METLDYWRLADEVSVVQAALLIVGEDPALHQDYIDENDAHHRPVGYDATLSALKNAILSGGLAATFRHDARKAGYDEYPNLGEDHRPAMEAELMRCDVIYKEEPNWHKTTVFVEDLRAWLTFRGFKTGFFFADNTAATDDFLSEKHPHYAPKLAAAIGAWKAVTGDASRLNGKTAKQALEKWLREHASQFGLTKDDGNPNETGIEEICKVANWNPGGGAAKTPIGNLTPLPADGNPPTPKKSGKIRVVAPKGQDDDQL